MPKRKNSRSREEDINHYKNKIRKLERKIRDRQISASESVSDLEEAVVLHDEDIGADTPAMRPDDWLLEWPPEDETVQDSHKTCEPQPGPSTCTDVHHEEPIAHDVNIPDLDTEILEILGDDPTNTDKYGPDIRNEVANRLLHIAKDGLNKENRKDLISKYLLPKNCIQIDAPKINLEIKAAIADTAIKRDKGLENKQKQMSSAIACLADIINSQLNSKTITNDVLQKLMDISRRREEEEKKRSREPAASRAQYPPPQTQYMPPHTHSSKTSSRGHQATYPRRRF